MIAAFNRALLDLDGIRASNPLPAIVGANVKLRRAGNEWKACCPFHEDRSPSFTIFNGGVRFHCFGCGASGDVMDYLQRLHGVGLPEAAAMLEGGTVPTVAIRQLPPEPERDTAAEAVSIWRSAVAAPGTPVEAYLRGRGLHLSIPASIRFSRLRYGTRGDVHPCLVALVTSVENKAVGIQRTYLTEDGRKADVPTVKLSLGRIRGAAIRLAPAAAELVVTGGLEDGLTLLEQLGRAVWAVTGEGNMASLELPKVVRSVVIAADNDASGEAHAQRAAEAFVLDDRGARIIRPEPGFKDFNSQLQGVRA
jgi:DNA primase